MLSNRFLFSSRCTTKSTYHLQLLSMKDINNSQTIQNQRNSTTNVRSSIRPNQIKFDWRQKSSVIHTCTNRGEGKFAEVCRCRDAFCWTLNYSFRKQHLRLAASSKQSRACKILPPLAQRKWVKAIQRKIVCIFCCESRLGDTLIFCNFWDGLCDVLESPEIRWNSPVDKQQNVCEKLCEMVSAGKWIISTYIMSTLHV